MHTDPKDILDALRAQGWRVERTPQGHWKCFPPDRTQRPVIVSRNPAAIKKIVAELKRSGFRGE